jgi:hypothetical protein
VEDTLRVVRNTVGAVGASRAVPAHLTPSRAYPVQEALVIDSIEANGKTTYVMTLPLLPESKNVTDGWPPNWRAGAKKRWMEKIQLWCDQMNLPRGCQRVGLAAELVFPNRASRRDPQNYAQNLWNYVPDALVAAGVLVDDNEGRVLIGPNWGIKMTVDDRQGPAKARRRTRLAITVEHPKMKTS